MSASKSNTTTSTNVLVGSSKVSNKIIYTIITLYLLICFAIIVILAADYIYMLLDLEYSNRNQNVCGSNPLERDTVRYSMYNNLENPVSKFATLVAPIDLVIVVISIVVIASIFSIGAYIFGSKHPIFKFFDNDKLYITSITGIILMGFCIGFWYNYKIRIKNVSETNTYKTHMDVVINSGILPTPKPISPHASSLNSSNIFDINLKDDKNKSNYIHQNLYTKIVSRMMFVDNLNSYQDAINKWNGFTENTDIYPYIVFTNDVKNDITSDTIIANDHLKLWQDELKKNTALANAIGANVSVPSTSILYNISLVPADLSTSTQKYPNVLKINYVDLSSVINYNIDKPPVLVLNPNSNITNIPTSLTSKTVDYITKSILPYLNSSTNMNNSSSVIPSSIVGITTYMQVLVGSQQVNNDYNILHTYALQKMNTQLLQSLYWLSTLKNGDPSNDIYDTMTINATLYNISNIIVTYIPFHLCFTSVPVLPIAIFGIIAIFLIHVVSRFYVIYTYYKYNLEKYKKVYTVYKKGKPVVETTPKTKKSSRTNSLLMIFLAFVLLFILAILYFLR